MITRLFRTAANLGVITAAGIGCDSTPPVEPEPDTGQPTLRILGRDTIVASNSLLRIRGTAEDPDGIAEITYSYAGGPETRMSFSTPPGNDDPASTTVEFDTLIAAWMGHRPLVVTARDHAGARSSEERVVGGTAAHLNVSFTNHVRTDETGAVQSYEMRVSGTAPRIAELEHFVTHSVTYARSSYPLDPGPPPDQPFAFVPRLSGGSGSIGVAGRDSSGLTMDTASLVYSGRVAAELLTPVHRMFVPEGTGRIDLRIAAAFTWSGPDVVNRIRVVDATGDTALIPIDPAREVEFEWAAGLAGRKTLLEVIVDTRLGNVLHAQFPVVQVPDPSVSGEFEHVVQMGRSTCGITLAAVTYCWGWLTATGVGSPSLVPVRVLDPFPLVRMFAGGQHWCGLDAEGAAYCWGSNYDGELGDGTGVARSEPTPVTGGIRFRKLDLHWGKSCGLAIDGSAYCWGQTGPPFERGRSVSPVLVPGDVRFRDIAVAPEMNCGVSEEGAVYCWDGWSKPAPVPIGGPSNFLEINSFGTYGACALDDAGDVWCSANATNTEWVLEREVAGLGLTSLVGGPYSLCATTAGGSAYCWEPGSPVSSPTRVPGDLVFRSLSTAGSTCGVTENNAIYCWGRGDHGQLGNGTRYSLDQPVRVLDP